MSVNRLPLAARKRPAVWLGEPSKGPKPTSHSKLALLLAKHISALHKSGKLEDLELLRGHGRLNAMNRAAVRRAHHFARRRNWTTAAQVKDLCAERSFACHE